MDQLVQLLSTGGWVALAGFGIYIGHKVAITWIIGYSTIKIVVKIVDLIKERASQGMDSDFCKSISDASGFTFPLSDGEKNIIIARIRGMRG